MCLDPIGEHFGWQIPGGKRKECHDAALVVRYKFKPDYHQEQFHDHGARALVGVDEWMVTSNAERQTRSQDRYLASATRVSVARPSERGLKQSEIAYAGLASVLSEPFVVDDEHSQHGDRNGYPIGHGLRLLREFAQRRTALL